MFTYKYRFLLFAVYRISLCYLLIVLTITIVTVNRAFYRKHQCQRYIYNRSNCFHFVVSLPLYPIHLVTRKLCLLISILRYLALMFWAWKVMNVHYVLFFKVKVIQEKYSGLNNIYFSVIYLQD